MTDIEIPYKEDRNKRYLFFEKLPGMVSWTILLSPIFLSIFYPTILVYALIVYLLIWFAKAVGMNIRVIEGWRRLRHDQKLDWQQMLVELEAGEVTDPNVQRPKWHYDNLLRTQVQPLKVKPTEVINAIIIATYNESMETLEPTFQSILNSHYDMKQIILILAYEERGGAEIEKRAEELMRRHGNKFLHAFSVKHPKDIPQEVIGKGGNITYAGRELQKYVVKQKIDPDRVLVTTLDADNRPHPSYLAAVSYTFAVSPDPKHTSYQPVALYTQNIWDVPAPMRVIATGNSFFQVVAAMRIHALRNFSSHAQPLSGLIETDFWSVRTIVEDGHQFWRSYFTFDGKYEVYPIFVPIYQDAVLAVNLRRTLVAQFIQLRRWAWGCSDIAYVAEMGFFRRNKLPKADLIAKLWRLFEGHISWATAALLVAGTAFIPAVFHPNSYAANQLPTVASRIETVALTGIVITFFLSILLLPPKPARYKKRRHFWMTVQWVFLPFTTIIYNGLSGLVAQTRLMFGRYIDKFDVTEKAVVTESSGRVTSDKT
jgi:cellulose synthase/poly-beta-1,6-N-acetylglucosamine synthase-like glycosyltransferase